MRRLRIFILLTVSLVALLAPKQLVNACGFTVFPGEYRFWLLQPDLTREAELTPFYFAATYMYKNDENIGRETYMQKNIEEWMAHLQESRHPVRRADIDSVLNNMSPRLFFGHIDSLARTNSFLRCLLLKESHAELRYLQLSKKVEEIAANPDPWEEGPVPHANVGRIIDEARLLYRQTEDPFIKLRTAFQLMRLYGYNGNAAELCRVYDERIAPVETASWIKSAGLYLKAIRGGLPDADRLLAQVFDRGDYNRSYCLTYLRSSRIDSLIRTTDDAHQRVVLRAMKAFNYPGRALADIQSIYSAEPGYREIPFLLLREINKTEDWLLTGQVTEFQPAVYHATYYWQYSDDYNKYGKANLLADRAYAARLREFLLRLVKERRAAQPALIRLFAAHLSMLTGDYETAGQQLRAAGAFGDLPRNVRSQISINRFLLGLETRKKLDASLEASFLRILREPADRLGICDADVMKDQLVLYTARKMMRFGDKARGLMLLSRTRRALGTLPISFYKDVYEEVAENAAPADYDSMVAILDRVRKTPLEWFVTRGRFRSPMEYYHWADSSSYVQSEWDRNRLLDGKACWYLRENNLEAAVQTLHRIPDWFWDHGPYNEYIGGNPFYLDIYKTGHYAGKRPLEYNKRTIVERMIALEALVGNDPSRRAEAHFQLANAWYNMSWWGNNWLMVKPWWSMNEMEDYGPGVERSSFNDSYYGCDRARDLYLLAMRETSDKRLAALCCFMAGVCNNHKRQYLAAGSGKSSVVHRNPYVRDLREKGVDERYYREIVRECAVYVDYIRRFDRAL